MKNNKFKMVLGATISCLLWGSAFPTLKITYDQLNLSSTDIQGKIMLAAMRFMLASFLIFIFYSLKNKSFPKPKKGYFSYLIVLGVFQTTLQYLFFYTGLANTSGVKGAVLASSATFFVVIIAHYIYHDDRISLYKMIGLLLGFSGIILINYKGDHSRLFEISLFGEGFLLIAGLISAIGTILAKNVAGKVNPFIMTGYQMFFGSSLLLGLAFILGDFDLHFTFLAFLLLIYSAFLSATAFIIWYFLLSQYKASIISMYKFLIPIFGAALSLIFIPGETVTIQLLIGIIFVAYGIYIVNKKRNNKKKNK